MTDFYSMYLNFLNELVIFFGIPYCFFHQYFYLMLVPNQLVYKEISDFRKGLFIGANQL